MNKPRSLWEEDLNPLTWVVIGYLAHDMPAWGRWAFLLIWAASAILRRLFDWWDTPPEIHKPERPL